MRSRPCVCEGNHMCYAALATLLAHRLLSHVGSKASHNGDEHQTLSFFESMRLYLTIISLKHSLVQNMRSGYGCRKLMTSAALLRPTRKSWHVSVNASLA